MIDFHCHLDLYPNPYEVADMIQRHNVGVLSVTNTPSAWQGTSKLAIDRSTIRTALGLHPQLAKEREHELPLFEEYLPNTRFVGEVGLDGSPDIRNTQDSQIRVFDFVLTACTKAAGDKIISIHSRRSATAVLDKLEKWPKAGVLILHWFSGTREELNRATSLDCWFSVGPAMLAGAKGRLLASNMPRDRVLLETDGPFSQQSNQPLKPWDLEVAVDRLSNAWRIHPDETKHIIGCNEASILSTKPSDL